MSLYIQINVITLSFTTIGWIYDNLWIFWAVIGRQCDMSTVRIFSTLILLALDGFGEPIRTKHGRWKQHTGEGEEKESDCLNQHSDVTGPHTLHLSS